jgi:hypothetical protein
MIPFIPLFRISRISRSSDAMRHGLLLSAATLAVLLAGCKSTPLPPYQPSGTPSAPAAPATVPKTQPTQPVPTPPVSRAPVQPSNASSARDYRRDGAKHLYQLNAHRIYPGMLPPLLYAVGVLEIEIDRQGNVMQTHWLRAPSHAPEVVAEIEDTVRNASPFPAASRLGRLTYTDTWLWDKSGRFQLDTLTEGQQ